MTTGLMAVTQAEREFVLEWAREWTKSYTFIGSARKALKELGIPEQEMEGMIYALYTPQEQCADAKNEPREVVCPWTSISEFEERKKLWSKS